MNSDSLIDHLRKVNLEMERHFYRHFSPKNPLQSLPEGMWQPYTDVYETKAALVVKMELAGVKREDISINLYPGRLKIKGVRRDSPLEEKRVYHQVEINYMEFERVVILPETVRHEAIRAEYKDGFLTVIIVREPTNHGVGTPLKIEVR